MILREWPEAVSVTDVVICAPRKVGLLLDPFAGGKR